MRAGDDSDIDIIATTNFTGRNNDLSRLSVVSASDRMVQEADGANNSSFDFTFGSREIRWLTNDERSLGHL
jgi:hypothetical protein